MCAAAAARCGGPAIGVAMPTKQSLTPYDVTKILNWGKRWKRLKTLKGMAAKYRVSESTIRRIIENGGYAPPVKRADLDDLAMRCDSFSSVPRGTNQGAERA